MYALIDIKGKQYKAEKGSKLKIDKIETNLGETIEFNSVLMLSGTEDKEIKIGNPYVKGASVKAKVTEHIRDKKITVFKYKRRKDYKRKLGHRQPFSIIEIEDIIG